MGLALSQMDEADARDTLESLEELSGMYAEFEIRAGAAETSGPLHPASRAVRPRTLGVHVRIGNRSMLISSSAIPAALDSYPRAEASR